MRYDYYRVNVPEDVAGELTGVDAGQYRCELAIDMARVQARIYAMPCVWTAWVEDGEWVKVRRIRL